MSVTVQIRQPALAAAAHAATAHWSSSRFRAAAMSAVWLAASATGMPAHAHEAPSGWSYPFSCCSGYDCREVSSTAISERPEGYVIKRTGEIVAHSDTRLKNSPDGEYHWCSVAGADNTRTICLFVPPNSF